MSRNIKLIIGDKSGQLGNRLFVFAHIIAHAIENDYNVVNLSFDEYCQYFSAFESDLYCRYPLRTSSRVPSSQARKALFEQSQTWMQRLEKYKLTRAFIAWIKLALYDVCYMSNGVFQRFPKWKKMFFLFGYRFRDHEAFDKHAEMLRRIFRPTAPIQTNVDALVEQCRHDVDVLVGIHIRQGDYKNFMGGMYFYEGEQYTRLMKNIERLFADRRVSFLICSNLKQEPSTFASFEHHFGTNHLVEDMYSFAKCDYVAGPPSTFTLYSGSICQDTEAPIFTLGSSPLSCVVRSLSKYTWAGVL